MIGASLRTCAAMSQPQSAAFFLVATALCGWLIAAQVRKLAPLTAAR